MEGKSYEGSRVMARRAALVGLVALVTAGFGGCGDSAEPSGPTVTQRITRDFGHELLASEQSAPLAGHGTVLRLLREYEEVKTSAGGSAVSSIDGLKADWERKSENDDESTWALIVNGIEADENVRYHYELELGNRTRADRTRVLDLRGPERRRHRRLDRQL